MSLCAESQNIGAVIKRRAGRGPVFPQTLNCNHDQCDSAHLFVVHVMAEFMCIWKEVGSTQVYHGHTHGSQISFPRLP